MVMGWFAVQPVAAKWNWLNMTPVLASSTQKNCEGAGEWQGTDFLVDAVEYSRSYGGEKTMYEGNSAIRFNGEGPVSTRVEYDICVPETGKYEVLVHTYANGHRNNGMHIGVNGVLQKALPGHPYAGTTAIYLTKNAWSWYPQWLHDSTDRHLGPVVIVLQEGLQTFSLHKRIIERPYIHQIKLRKLN